MINLHIVGLGSLGSCLANEVAKRAMATAFPMALHLYDDDKVESRNVAAQHFSPRDLNKSKVEAVAENLEPYNVEVKTYQVRLTQENISELMKLDGQSIILDCVDNITARHLLWNRGLCTDTPVLHLSMSEVGSGEVSWNWREVDTFSLSPKNLSPQKLEEIRKPKEEKKMPPCELNSFRGLILNTILAGLNSLFIFLGKDITKEYAEVTENGELPGIMSTWTTNTAAHKCMVELTQHQEWSNSAI
jgi:hypothetical protein